MRSILLLPLVARCLETIDVCIWRMFVFMSVVVTVWGGNVCCVVAVVKNSVFFSIGVLKYECQRVECAFTSPVRTECGMSVSAVL